MRRVRSTETISSQKWEFIDKSYLMSKVF